MNRISVLIISKNEELHIARCVDSAKKFFNDVVVLDSLSQDKTASIAQEHGARVVDFAWDGQYPKKKQWGLEHASIETDWVLILDGDEWITDELGHEIRDLEVGAGGTVAYDIPLSYIFMGRLMAHGHQVKKRVLVNRQSAAFPVLNDLSVPNPFEMELHVQPVPTASGGLATLASPLGHEDLEPLSHWFDRHNRYSDWEAHLAVNGEQAERTRQGRLFARVPFKPLAFFVYGYIARGGYRDGYEGLQYAIAQSFYYWQTSIKTRELQRSRANGLAHRP